MFHEVILGSTEKRLSNLHIEGAHIPLGIALVIVLAHQTCMPSLRIRIHFLLLSRPNLQCFIADTGLSWW